MIEPDRMVLLREAVANHSEQGMGAIAAAKDEDVIGVLEVLAPLNNCTVEELAEYLISGGVRDPEAPEHLCGVINPSGDAYCLRKKEHGGGSHSSNPLMEGT